jgi:hypothetical protein
VLAQALQYKKKPGISLHIKVCFFILAAIWIACCHAVLIEKPGKYRQAPRIGARLFYRSFYRVNSA